MNGKAIRCEKIVNDFACFACASRKIRRGVGLNIIDGWRAERAMPTEELIFVASGITMVYDDV